MKKFCLILAWIHWIAGTVSNFVSLIRWGFSGFNLLFMLFIEAAVIIAGCHWLFHYFHFKVSEETDYSYRTDKRILQMEDSMKERLDEIERLHAQVTELEKHMVDNG